MCRKRLRSPKRDDVARRRMLWCQTCNVRTDRDVNAAIVLSESGLARFASFLPQREGRQQQMILLAGEKGEAAEAVRGNGSMTPILRVDASKLGGGHHPMLDSISQHPLT